MSRNTVTLLVVVLLATVSLAHLLRIVFGIPVTVADAAVPMWVSGVVAVVTGGLGWLLFKGSR